MVAANVKFRLCTCINTVDINRFKKRKICILAKTKKRERFRYENANLRKVANTKNCTQFTLYYVNNQTFLIKIKSIVNHAV